MTPITTAPARRRFVALLVAGALALATAAVVSGDENEDVAPDVVAGPPIVAQQTEDEDEQEAAEDEAEDAEDRAEDEAEALEDELERQQEADEDAADDCAETDETTFGGQVCRLAQAWKDTDATQAPADQGETVSTFARENNPGAAIQEQISQNGVPDAAANALANAGPNGDGPPGGGDDDVNDDEEEEDEEEDE